MRCTNKKSILIIIFSLLILIIIVLFASSVYFYLSKDYKAKNSENTTSYPVSDTNPTSKNIKFTIDTPEMLIRPEKSVIEAKSFLDSTYEIEVKGIAASIKGEGFEIYMFSNMGESGGFHKSVSIESIITENKLGEKLFKVKTAHENLDGNTLEDQYQQYFFYTSDFRTMEQCGNVMPDYDGCGSFGMNIETDNYENFSYSVYCGVNEQSVVINCDQFVKNLEVNIKKVPLKNQSFKFVLNQITVATPLNGVTEDFNLETSIPSDISIEQGNDFLKSEKFLITFIADPEPLPIGLGGPPLPETRSVKNNFEKVITRVNEDVGVKREMEFQSSIEDFTKFYYYTDSFRQGLDCGGSQFINNFCGGDAINIKIENKKLDLNLNIRCAIKTSEDIKYCDELVDNIIVR